MERRLANFVTIQENNADCVILKVKKNAFMGLASLGCFDGTETFIRLTKGSNHTCTLWHKNGNIVSWEWGSGGYTLVCDSLAKIGRLVQNCIEYDFGIVMEGKNIATTLNVKSLKDAPKKAVFEEMYWKTQTERCVHKDGDFFRHFNSDTAFRDWLKLYGWKIEKEEDSIAKTGCIVKTLTCSRK